MLPKPISITVFTVALFPLSVVTVTEALDWMGGTLMVPSHPSGALTLVPVGMLTFTAVLSP
jgi:hypothetical protein